MNASDPLEILLAHDRWATGQVMDACARLSDEQFHRRFDIGPGSLHDTLTHIVGTVRALTETLAGMDARPRLEEGPRRTVAELRGLLDESYDEFAAAARRRPLDETVSRQTKTGKLLTMTRGAMVTHVTTHGTHHRAQCLNMLRQLGATPLPAVSVAEWTWLAAAKG